MKVKTPNLLTGDVIMCHFFETSKEQTNYVSPADPAHPFMRLVTVLGIECTNKPSRRTWSNSENIDYMLHTLELGKVLSEQWEEHTVINR